MSLTKILVTRRLPEAILAPIKARGSTVLELWDSDEPMPPATLLETAARVKPHGMVVMLSDRVTREVIDACGGNLRGVATLSVGYNNVDVTACVEKKIRIGYTPGILSETTADLALALTLATARKLQPAMASVRGGSDP